LRHGFAKSRSSESPSIQLIALSTPPRAVGETTHVIRLLICQVTIYSWIGQLGSTLDTQEGQQAARQVAIDLIGTLQGATGDLNSVCRIVKLMVLVNSAATFTEQHIVANGASQLFQEVFGDRGVHARSAFGAAQVPFGSCVEIELIAELA
jgi:enamine deaminase RidA (YjgF/YER057c/UK114 family)